MNNGPNFGLMDELVPAVIQDHITSEVLMVGYLNQEAWNLTTGTGICITIAERNGDYG